MYIKLLIQSKYSDSMSKDLNSLFLFITFSITFILKYYMFILYFYSNVFVYYNNFFYEEEIKIV